MDGPRDGQEMSVIRTSVLTMTMVDVEAVMTALDELDAAWAKLASLPVHALDALQVLETLDRLEIHRRRNPPWSMRWSPTCKAGRLRWRWAPSRGGSC